MGHWRRLQGAKHPYFRPSEAKTLDKRIISPLQQRLALSWAAKHIARIAICPDLPGVSGVEDSLATVNQPAGNTFMQTFIYTPSKPRVRALAWGLKRWKIRCEFAPHGADMLVAVGLLHPVVHINPSHGCFPQSHIFLVPCKAVLTICKEIRHKLRIK